MTNKNDFSADIQYESSFVTECSIDSNLIDIGEDAVLESNVEVGVSNPTTDEKSKRKFGSVRLTLDGTYSIKNNPEAFCKYHLVLIGEFSAESSLDDDEFSKLLWFNGSTSLYSIARGKIETISSTVLNTGKISLPMVNMIKLLQAQFSKIQKSPQEEKTP